MLEHLSKDSSSIIACARKEAYRTNFGVVHTDDVMLALLREAKWPISDIFADAGITIETFRAQVTAVHGDMLEPSESPPASAWPLSEGVVTLLQRAHEISKQSSHSSVQCIHLVLGLLSADAEGDPAIAILKRMAVDLDSLKRKLSIHLKLLARSDSDGGKWMGNELIRTNDPESMGNSVAVQSGTMDRSESQQPLSIEEQLAAYFSEEVNQLLDLAQTFAAHFSNACLGAHDILRAMIAFEESLAHKLLEKIIDTVELEQILLSKQPTIAASTNDPLLAKDARSILLQAYAEASKYAGKIEAEHLLIAIVEEDASATLPLNECIKTTTEARRKVIYSFSAEIRARESGNQQVFPPEIPALFAKDRALPRDLKAMTLSDRAIRILRYSVGEAKLLHHVRVNSMHLLLAVIREAETSEVAFVRNRELPFANLSASIAAKAMEQARNNPVVLEPRTDGLYQMDFHPDIRTILLGAYCEARELRFFYVDLHHLVLAILQAETDFLSDLLQSQNLSAVALVRRMRHCMMIERHHPRSKTQVVILDELDSLFPSDTIIDKEFFQAHKSLVDSNRYINLLRNARQECCDLDVHDIEIEHLILAILRSKDGAACEALHSLGLTLESTQAAVRAARLRGAGRVGQSLKLSRRAQLITAKAKELALALHTDTVEPEHVLLTIGYESDGIAALVCQRLDISGDELVRHLMESKQKWS